VDVGSACVDIRPSPKTDVLVSIFDEYHLQSTTCLFLFFV